MFKLSNASLALGLVLAGGLGLSSSAFSMNDLSQGYTLAAADQVKSSTEGKCGEDKFAKTDTNHDGKVSRDEFRAAAPDRIAEFDKIDANGDGFISLDEATQYLAEQAKNNAEGKCGEGKCGEGKCGAAIEP
ncbi:calcium-binding protein [Pseudomonas daroniae]|uniref:Calcium-binding protein n=1 Tax=Phytopseudomonas daroniae TaxID=2487519 RepID=A0A4Q9QMH5_9GAMM|nr:MULTISPECIES: EF-hand domain-containing protein [Pseudomonas]TBU79796.1 calcium-binding protein [Pseudomonas daroniae]TBU82485.1 calcium-binding protein [Pseudomonas sp. FRB 228]TBU91802.1 calcium-binding protein [Pseudomonas daroniae]